MTEDKRRHRTLGQRLARNLSASELGKLGGGHPIATCGAGTSFRIDNDVYWDCAVAPYIAN